MPEDAAAAPNSNAQKEIGDIIIFKKKF